MTNDGTAAIASELCGCHRQAEFAAICRCVFPSLRMPVWPQFCDEWELHRHKESASSEPTFWEGNLGHLPPFGHYGYPLRIIPNGRRAASHAT